MRKASLGGHNVSISTDLEAITNIQGAHAAEPGRDGGGPTTARSCYRRRNGPKTFKHKPEQIVSPTASMAIEGIAARKMDFIGVMLREAVPRDERRRRIIAKRLRQRRSLAETLLQPPLAGD